MAQQKNSFSTGRALEFDLVRALCLFVVVTVHFSHDLFFFDIACANPGQCPRTVAPLDYSTILRWLSWVEQPMPLFFFVGGFANAAGPRQGEYWGEWLFRRIQRLYRPLIWFLPAMFGLFFVYTRFFSVGELAPMDSWGLVLLWFLAIYPLCLAAVPLLRKIQTTRNLALFVLCACLAIGLVDFLRWHNSKTPAIAVSFFIVWIVPFSLGVGFRHGLISRRAGGLMTAFAAIFEVALYGSGRYSNSLLDGDPHGKLANFVPPSLLFAGYSILTCGLAIMFAPWLRAIATVPPVRRVVDAVNNGAMTLYLGHWVTIYMLNSALLIGVWYPIRSSSPSFWSEKGPAALLFLPLLFLVFFLFRPLELRPMRWWDAPVSAAGWRSPVVGVLLIFASLSIFVVEQALAVAPPKGYLLAVPTVCLLASARLLSRRAKLPEGRA